MNCNCQINAFLIFETRCLKVGGEILKVLKLCGGCLTDEPLYYT